ncbi:PAS domain S-box-containing protein [Desulfonatronum zhilinae]|nr:PAS domain S-box-containing protein [Desulfonatronum zhilinae]
MNKAETHSRSFGDRLKYLRTLKGMTQAELAVRAGLSVKHVGRIERGKASPSFSLIQDFALALDTPPLNFFLHFEHVPTHQESSGLSPKDEPRMPSGNRMCAPIRLATWFLGGPNLKPFWSDSLYVLLGDAPFSIRPTAKRFLKHVRPSQQDAAARFLEKALQGEADSGILVDIVTKHDRENKLMLNPDIFRTSPEAPSTTQLIIQDVTYCMALNHALTLRQDELETYVAKKNKDISEVAHKFKLEAEQRKQAEKGLRIFEQMVDSSHDAQAFVDADGVIVAVNRQYEALMGVSADEVEGRQWTEFLIDYWGREDFERVMRPRVEKALTGEEQCSFHEWRTYRDGSRKYVHVIYTPCRRNGDVAGVVVTIHDLSSFMEIHERLEQRERLHRQVLETANEGIVMVDAEQRITFANKNIETLFGYTSEEVLDTFALAYVHPEDLDIAHAQSTKNRAGNAVRYLIRLIHKNGRAIWTFHSASPLIDSKTKFNGTLIMMMDVTELKLANESLQKRDELLELGAEATVSLLREADQEQVISDILARLGRITDSDRVYIFRNQEEAGTGRMRTKQIFEWIKPGISPQIDNPELQNASYDEVFPRWLREMKTGRCIKGLVRSFPEMERALLESQEIQSLLAVPIRVDGFFWGFLGFDAVRRPRTWVPAEENALRIIATAIGAAIMRNASEATIASQYSLLEGLFENIPLGIVVWDRAGNLLKSNNGFHEMTGYPPGSIRTLEDWFHLAYPDEKRRKEALEYWKQSPLEAAKTIRDYPVTCANGVAKHVEFRVNRLADGCSIITMTDVTQRKLAEQVLREGHKEFKTLAEKCPISIIRFDHQGRITFVNDWHMKVFAQEKLGKSFYIGKLIHELPGLVKAGVGEEVARILRGESIELKEVLFPEFMGGHSGWASIRGEPIITEGKVAGGVLIREDVTQRKQTEQALEENREELKTLLADKDKFLSIIAHDLRSPMSGLLGLARMVVEEDGGLSPKELWKIAKIMGKTVGDLFALLENLLDWSRMQRGLTAFEPVPCVVREVIANNMGLLRPAAIQKQVAMNNMVASELVVFADRAMLNTVIRNLLSNALKFTVRGGKVDVVAEEMNQESTVVVQDSGVGMDQETLNNIFALARKTSSPGTEGETGSGLGLILCKEFVERHGGRIWAKSAPGLGSIFFFTLPRS